MNPMPVFLVVLMLSLCGALCSCVSSESAGGMANESEAPNAVLPDETGQFDFWIGDWNLAWAGGAGTNSISQIFAGSVILEEFNDPNTGFAGGSMSQWRQSEGKWRQVWMDNQGAYLIFDGGWDGEQMSLALTNPQDTPNPDRIARMRWHSITDDALVWTYEGSVDDGATWSTLWEINYTRRQ